MNYNICLRYILLSFFLFAVSCSEPEEPVTKDEAVKLATSLIRAIARQDASRFNELLDMDAIEKRIQNQAGDRVGRPIVERATKTMRSGEYR